MAQGHPIQGGQAMMIVSDRRCSSCECEVPLGESHWVCKEHSGGQGEEALQRESRWYRHCPVCWKAKVILIELWDRGHVLGEYEKAWVNDQLNRVVQAMWGWRSEDQHPLFNSFGAIRDVRAEGN